MACLLCGVSKNIPLLYGDFLEKRDILCHHYCLLFSWNLPQRGADSEGLQGFKLNDIRHCAKACAYKVCHYCRGRGAHAVCCARDCRKKFHLVCAIHSGALLSFYGRFDVHCSEHRPRQQEPKQRRAGPCGICLAAADQAYDRRVLCTPCCGHVFHRLCLQKMALSSGYFFTCPICRDKNNRTGFLRHMKKFGVFVPQRDASWEMMSNAFSELLQHHSGCDQRYCLSRAGRRRFIDGDREWAQLLCTSCGSRGAHRACAGLPRADSWFCPDCAPAFCAGGAAAVRPPTLRQVLMSERRPASALSLPTILPDLSWPGLLRAVDDPRQLLRFSWSHSAAALKIRTRCIQDPRNPGHEIPSEKIHYRRRDLQPVVVVSSSERRRADRALMKRRDALLRAKSSDKYEHGSSSRRRERRLERTPAEPQEQPSPPRTRSGLPRLCRSDGGRLTRRAAAGASGSPR